MRFRPDLLAPPVLTSHEHARKVTWFELFNDLVFVVAISQLASRIYADFSPAGIANGTLLFAAFWWAWVGMTFYSTRFLVDDLTHRAVVMLQMFAVVSMAVAVPGALEDRAPTFALGYMAVRLLMVFEYFRTGCLIPTIRPLVYRYAGGFTLAASLWAASLAFPPQVRPWIWLGSMGIDYLVPVVFSKWGAKYPPNVHHAPERFGLFTIIILGESIVSVGLALDKAKLAAMALCTAFAAWIVGFGTWWGYFDGIRAAESRSGKGNWAPTFRTWMYSHFPLQLGFILTAVGFKVAISKPEYALAPPVAYATTVGSVVTMWCMALIFLIGPGAANQRAQAHRFLRAHYVLNGLGTLLIPISPWLPAYAVVLSLALIWVGHILAASRESGSAFDGELELEE